MPRFSTLSRQRLETCDERLRVLLNEAIKTYDLTVLCGHRGEEEQEEAYRLGNSTKRWPESRHNVFPSHAVDVAPWFADVKIDWNDLAAFARLIGYIERIAHERAIPLRFGLDWDSDRRTADERFIDAGHIELAQHS